jgi:hypothetical protein
MTFDEHCGRFHTACQKHRAFGAMDGEPAAVFRSLLRRALKGKDVTVPTSASGWELYASERGADVAAAELAAEAKPCVEFAKQAARVVAAVEGG